MCIKPLGFNNDELVVRTSLTLQLATVKQILNEYAVCLQSLMIIDHNLISYIIIVDINYYDSAN